MSRTLHLLITDMTYSNSSTEEKPWNMYRMLRPNSGCRQEVLVKPVKILDKLIHA